VAIAAADRDRAAGLAHQLLAERFRQMPYPEIGERGIAERKCGRRELIFLEARDWRQVSQLGQCIGQPGNSRFRQIGARRDFLIAKQPVIGLECPQDVKSAGQRDDEAAIGRLLFA